MYQVKAYAPRLSFRGEDPIQRVVENCCLISAERNIGWPHSEHSYKRTLKWLSEQVAHCDSSGGKTAKYGACWRCQWAATHTWFWCRLRFRAWNVRCVLMTAKLMKWGNESRVKNIILFLRSMFNNLCTPMVWIQYYFVPQGWPCGNSYR